MINVLAGVVGALLGFSGALLGAWIKSRGEHRKWLREQKLAGAAEMVSAGTNIYEFRSGSKAWLESFEPSELREWQSQLQKGRAAIHLLCTRETRDRADAFVRSCWHAKDDKENLAEAVQALRAFTASLRKEVGSD
ncbi:hypothetical protein A8924_0699 [Saccharopolyspora erythraea NRRL 2338]|uniref:Uncharacterized protein n=2 Tax=Saccharopolyspora erythraea TaxID=1836 RepID=A4F6I0_SACEN|nr:hypothetical protein [Saccharopolyspora erythraea]EQD85406.1 hypothetical protein N599_14940 [Saccharopolyspora erythraea D]PFG93457.1 hypothetical protein A8924_0699 [Saccharopolyspora erythraea NRRL 2338]QRK90327.1 hypothetical protein JQX30_02005 [Saccharopolyspora erythraea]CAL99654.1 hypothetical protein SACE_0305 [Saccharopolyspora erythraea NRRL 2338]